MNDSFITALNTQRTTLNWMDTIIVNMSNIYSPGYRERKSTFSNFLQGVQFEDLGLKTNQGKAIPGTHNENVYIEGKGFFVIKKPDGKVVYTRMGQFVFGSDGTYRTNEGWKVQGYILNDKGEIMANPGTQRSDPNGVASTLGGPDKMATTEIKLWKDPSNGKYLGKYDEFEIKGDGIIYGKADKGKTVVPLYKLAMVSFNSPAFLTNVDRFYYKESENSGKPLAGTGKVRAGLLEMSNVNFKENIAFFAQSKMQLEMVNKVISTNKQLLEEAMKLLQ